MTLLLKTFPVHNCYIFHLLATSCNSHNKSGESIFITSFLEKYFTQTMFSCITVILGVLIIHFWDCFFSYFLLRTYRSFGRRRRKAATKRHQYATIGVRNSYKYTCKITLQIAYRTTATAISARTLNCLWQWTRKEHSTRCIPQECVSQSRTKLRILLKCL